MSFVYGQNSLSPNMEVGQPSERMYTAYNPPTQNQEAIPGPVIVHDIVGGPPVGRPTIGQPTIRTSASDMPPAPAAPAGGGYAGPPGAPMMGQMSNFGGGGGAPAQQAPVQPGPMPNMAPAQQPMQPMQPMQQMMGGGGGMGQLDGVLSNVINTLANTQAGSDPNLMGQMQLAAQILQAAGHSRAFHAIDAWSKSRGVQVAGLAGIENRVLSSWEGDIAPPGFFEKQSGYPMFWPRQTAKKTASGCGCGSDQWKRRPVGTPAGIENRYQSSWGSPSFAPPGFFDKEKTFPPEAPGLMGR